MGLNFDYHGFITTECPIHEMAGIERLVNLATINIIVGANGCGKTLLMDKLKAELSKKGDFQDDYRILFIDQPAVDSELDLGSMKRKAQELIHLVDTRYESDVKQIFAVAYTLEFIDTLLDTAKFNADSNALNKIRLIRLRRDDGIRTKVSILTGEEALEARENYNIDIRG